MNPGGSKLKVLLKLVFLCTSGIFSGLYSQNTGEPLLASNRTLLVGGNECEGVVVVYRNQSQYLVCDKEWNSSSLLASVVCREVGCGPPTGIWMQTPTWNSSVPVLQGIQCEGKESQLAECHHGEQNNSCDNSSLATLTCSSNKKVPGNFSNNVRLVGGQNSCEGHLDVFRKGSWGLMCSPTFHTKEGKVLCSQLGCKTKQVMVTFTERDPYPGRSSTVWSDNILCHGNESSIWQCQTDADGKSCPRAKHIYVMCSRKGNDENWITWLAIACGALIIVLFCCTRAIHTSRCCKQALKDCFPMCYDLIGKLQNCSNCKPERRRAHDTERFEEVTGPVEIQCLSEPESRMLEDSREINALLAPYGYCLNNTITPPPSYMNALKMISHPLENTLTPPPTYLEALKILARPVIVHVPVPEHPEEEEEEDDIFVDTEDSAESLDTTEQP
ncbi:scavenger receptor cysteine-rich type 1 protein M130-like [Protopterus annectens]|uniref:scavenger receptor cysteine-rich type 1 protein M130-like n=1 Tax=Protopterus annectens TaxID=7888 RepID=UPI001CFAE41B|nr:scavenger receptor cysteine-rich type 1 protein M130-like [Protopterus annectens]